MNQPKLTTADLESLKPIADLGFYDWNWETLRLARLKRVFAAQMQQYQDVLLIDEEGMSVTITISSPSKSLTLNGDRDVEMAILESLYGKMGARLKALGNEILNVEKERVENAESEAAQSTDQQRLMAICMPEAPAAPAPVCALAPTAA